MKIKSDPDPIINSSNNKGNHGSDSDSTLMIKISALEHERNQLRQEKDALAALLSKAEVDKFVAFQESERCKRDCSRLQDAVFRLEEDCSRLRGRDLKGQEMIQMLLDDMEDKEREFTEKYVELTTAINDLDCGKKRALKEADEWKSKFKELQDVTFRGAEGLNGKERQLNDEMPKTRRCDFVVIDGDSDKEEDHIALSRLGKRRSADCTEKASSSLQCHPSPTRARTSLQPRGNEEDTYELGNVGRQSFRKRNRNPQQVSRDCTGRMDVSDQQRLSANLKALKLQSSLNPEHPSFVKSLCQTSVSSCFSLSLPKEFCKQNIRGHHVQMVLEDAEHAEYDVIASIGDHQHLIRIGWKRFAQEHNLIFGDALVLELSEPRRFKVHIVRARLQEENADSDDEIAGDRVVSLKRGKADATVAGNLMGGHLKSCASTRWGGTL